MNSVQQWWRFFEQVSCFYKQGMLLSWKKYPNHTTDIWDSLAIFLEEYAFERQGRKPDYFHAAVDALLYYKKGNGDLNQNDAADKIWNHFSNSINGHKLNHQNNPLCPRRTSYQRKEKTYKTSKLSVIQIVSNNKDIQNKSFTTYLQHKIVEDKDIKSVFYLLKSIQGVGEKIASFFLRDLAHIMEIDLSETQNRHLLQPIDIWVARTVILLDENEFSKLKGKIKNGRSLNNKDKVKLAEWIVRQSEGNAANPELVNMGIWYFCSRIATSGYRLNRVLENLNDLRRAKSLADKHVMWIKNACKNCQDFA
ncbi:MAG TPA: hypothetical protein HPP66_08385 [Planctomycetes bacterium]|nr:hypothetical protein [Planctomycetota bacterium]